MDETLTTILSENKNLLPFSSIIEQIMTIPEDSFNENSFDVISGMVRGCFTPKVVNQAVEELIANFEENSYTRTDVTNIINSFEEDKNNFITQLHASSYKEQFINLIFDEIFKVFRKALDQYHNFNIVLPMTLEEGAVEPTYAHDSDAAADLYARETVVIPAHSLSNKVNTGIHIGLPEGWKAHIAPRSSIGAKTPLRLSNNLGIIDQGYLGPLIVLFDNISDFDYTINAGDRIAQLWVSPSYHFKANIVSELEDTDRHENGLGSTGK